MNAPDLERDLQRGLEHRAHGVFGTPIVLDDVRARARSIRRRRTVAATAAVAAAVAAVVVVPTAIAGVTGHRDDRPQPAPSVPTSTATAGTSAGGQPTGVLHDGRFTRPDGSVVRLPVDNADVSRVGALADGRSVVANQAHTAIEVYAADGSLKQRHRVVTLSVTMSTDGTLAAWLDADGRVEVLESGRADPVRLAPVPMPGEAVPVVDAVLGADCATGGCSVLAGDGTQTLSEVGVSTAVDLVTPELLRVDDVSPDGRTWAVTFPPTSGDRQYGCVGLYDPTARRVMARTCDTAGLEFAPDGRHLVGGFFENGAAAEVQVLDRDLRVVGTFDPGRAVVSGVGWADADHALAATAAPPLPGAGTAWSLLEVPIDAGGRVEAGATTVMDGPVEGRDAELVAEYLLTP